MSPHQTGTIFSRTRPPLCAVTLVDRRTGRPHLVNGATLVSLSRDPQLAAAGLLAGRDARIWDACIQPLRAGTPT